MAEPDTEELAGQIAIARQLQAYPVLVEACRDVMCAIDENAEYGALAIYYDRMRDAVVAVRAALELVEGV